MIRTRTALTASAVAVAAIAGGTATALAVDRPAAPSESFATVATPAPVVVAPAATAAAPRAAAPRVEYAGDDGLTHAQATKARRAALRAVPGRVVSIGRDDDRGVTYDVKIITRGGAAREVRLSSGFKATRTTNADRDGLTYATLGRASSAATKQVRGIVTGVDLEDEGRARYEVEVLTSRSTERIVRLSSSYGVVTGTTDDDGDDD